MNLLTFTSPNDLILEIPPTALNQAWTKSQVFSNANSRYQAYMNELCLKAILPWLQEEFTPQAKVSNSTALPSIWEFINGSTIDLDGTKIILVPHESMDLCELRIPQEWVDIPSLIGDYYLGVEIQPEDGFVRVWGYCTHTQIKNQAVYDSRDRTYALAADYMTIDISILAVEREFCQQSTRAAINPFPPLPTTQAENLINRLGNPEIISPRLEIPFAIWGALISHSGWRQHLYNRRLGQPEQFSVIQWLQNGVSQAAQQLGWDSLNLNFSSAGARSLETAQPITVISRQLTIVGQLYELRIIPQIDEEGTIWRFELNHTIPGAFIPNDFKLRLLTEDLQPFPDNEDIATKTSTQLCVEVVLESGEGIVWEIEPLPENYTSEILRF
ncbi:DUF1822 family protein [Calothrix sp. PCC 6303]|uniref:DUF1822 family protein n=1 Tax=Calothrix sp. PCC 6303 TaxID=1170562 RepID=UPI0002A0460C|nr:DUF1822 family protein [Calothrix sp. PCC 6303]AFZ04145.1 protein of unknown function DUF1822 [Calothrix sp. PCC 6303]